MSKKNKEQKDVVEVQQIDISSKEQVFVPIGNIQINATYYNERGKDVFFKELKGKLTIDINEAWDLVSKK